MRAIGLIESGESAREAARLLDLGASTTIRWVERWTSTGSVDALPGTGHCRSPLEEHTQWLFDLVVAEPDLTLDEIRIGRETKLEIGRSSVGRFFERHEITVKKKICTRRNRIDLMSRRHAPR